MEKQEKPESQRRIKGSSWNPPHGIAHSRAGDLATREAQGPRSPKPETAYRLTKALQTSQFHRRQGDREAHLEPRRIKHRLMQDHQRIWACLQQLAGLLASAGCSVSLCYRAPKKKSSAETSMKTPKSGL